MFLLDLLKMYNFGTEFSKILISFSTYFNTKMCKLTDSAGLVAEFKVTQVINDPTEGSLV